MDYFSRLLNIVHVERKLYLVFEFLDVDLKRYIETSRPLKVNTVKVCLKSLLRFSLFLAICLPFLHSPSSLGTSSIAIQRCQLCYWNSLPIGRVTKNARDAFVLLTVLLMLNVSVKLLNVFILRHNLRFYLIHVSPII